MTHDIRKHTLALALTLALAACGGGSDGTGDPAQPAGPATKAQKATPDSDEGNPAAGSTTSNSAANTTSSAASTTSGTTTTATTAGNTADATPSAAGTAAASTSNTAPPAAAGDDTPTTPFTRDGNTTKVRGSLLIQALLTRLPQRNAQNQPLLEWLNPDRIESLSIPDSQRITEPLAGPVLLTEGDIIPDTAGTGLNKFIYKLGLVYGPPRDSDSQGKATRWVNLHSAQFGVSLPGISRKPNTTTLPNGNPLEISPTLKMTVQQKVPGDGDQTTTEAFTLASEQVSTVEPNHYYDITRFHDTKWQHVWKAGEREVTLSATQPADQSNQLRTCLDFRKDYATHQTLCDIWEVPDSWTAGEPIKHLSQELEDSYLSEAAGDVATHWFWNDRKGTPPVTRDSLKAGQ